jgi:hypothetical protein
MNYEGGLRYDQSRNVFVPYNDFMAEDFDKTLDDGKDYAVTFELKAEKTRTKLQNKSLHLYCGKLGKAFDDAGLDMVAVLSELRKSTLSWTTEAVKEVVWRSIQIALGFPKSTTRLTTKQVQTVYENVNRFTSERLGVSVPWPDRFSQMEERS